VYAAANRRALFVNTPIAHVAASFLLYPALEVAQRVWAVRVNLAHGEASDSRTKGMERSVAFVACRTLDRCAVALVAQAAAELEPQRLDLQRLHNPSDTVAHVVAATNQQARARRCIAVHATTHAASADRCHALPESSAK
jgi:hypothetical protein